MTRPDRHRVVFVGHVRYDVPLTGGSAAKWNAVCDRLDAVIVAAAGTVQGADPRLRLLRDRGPGWLRFVRWHATLTLRLAAALRAHVPHAVVAQSPFEGAHALVARGLARCPCAVVVEVHADWRTATRLYGTRVRRLLSRPADRLASVVVRHADGVRTVSRSTTRLASEVTGKQPVATFPAFIDVEAFLGPPAGLPPTPILLWVGALQPVKGVDVLVRAWPMVASAVPEARLRIIGAGPLQASVERLRAAWPDRVETLSGLSSREVAAAMDGASLLVVPSRREAFGRVVVEAGLRGRPAVVSAVDGLAELVDHGVNGVLVRPGDPGALAQVVAPLLGTDGRRRLEEMGRFARRRSQARDLSPERYAAAVAVMVDDVIRRGESRVPAASVA